MTPQTRQSSHADQRKSPSSERKESKNEAQLEFDPTTVVWLFPSPHSAAAIKALSLNRNLVADPPAWVRRRVPASYARSGSSSSLADSLCIPFDKSFPKKTGCITFGTDRATSDIVLPPVVGLSRRHCALTFDRQSRLVLRDFSRHGSAVWYDDQTCGDRVNYEWILSCGLDKGFPNAVHHLFLDIQTVRFCLVFVGGPPNHSPQFDHTNPLVQEFEARVCRFLASPYDHDISARQAAIVRLPVAESDSLPDCQSNQYYMWNLARPWEPVVKVLSA